MLGLWGRSARRTAGLQTLQKFWNFKLNIWINIFNRSPIENVYSDIYFNFSCFSHPGIFVPAWTEDRQKIGGRTELHNEELHYFCKCVKLSNFWNGQETWHISEEKKTVTPPLRQHHSRRFPTTTLK